MGASRLPPGFSSTGSGERGISSMKVVRPPPGFSADHSGGRVGGGEGEGLGGEGRGGLKSNEDGRGGVSSLGRQLNGMRVYEEDWG